MSVLLDSLALPGEHPASRPGLFSFVPMFRKRLQRLDPIMALTVVLVVAALIALYLTVFTGPTAA